MRELSSILQQAIDGSVATLQALRELDEPLLRAADALTECLAAGRKLLVCGNGGSAADASHFATEFVVRFTKDRPAYPAICLTADGALLTAAGNDYGFDEVFARQVAAFGQRGDVLICLTTSGKSRNVQRAVEEAKQRDVMTIALLGRDGGPMLGTSDIELVVRGDSTARIQEGQMLLLHVLCEAVEERLAAR
jgi:D-sedoheptulose 7-phosphate isomerase